MPTTRPRPFLATLLLFVLALLAPLTAPAAEESRLRPYVLARAPAGDLAAAVAATREALGKQGFQVVGSYSPYNGAQVVVVTSDELRRLASLTDLGGYGAALRVAITQVGEKVQVSYVNPRYMHAIYRMKGDPAPVAAKLEGALGREKEFGSEQGLSDADLRDYHYMVMMPYFTDQVELAKLADYQTALQAVEAGLKAGKGGTQQVYRVEIPGKQQTLFGVGLKEGEGADQRIMGTIDSADLRHTAHLPYEILVSGGNVTMLHGKFRIAQSFPDLSMGTFMTISDAPDGTERALAALFAK